PATMTDWQRARRQLLARLGLGAAWLPLLRSTARAQGAVKKLICVAAIQGYRQNDWQPVAGPLQGQNLPKSVTALEPHKGDLIFLSGLRNVSAGGTGSYGTVYWGLPDAAGTSYKEPTGPTLDQVVASQSPAAARSSLAFGVQLDLPPVATTFPGGRRCFWQGAGM